MTIPMNIITQLFHGMTICPLYNCIWLIIIDKNQYQYCMNFLFNENTNIFYWPKNMNYWTDSFI